MNRTGRLDPQQTVHRPSIYRDIPTMSILAAIECGRWDLAEIDRYPERWESSASSQQYLRATIDEAEQEIARRSRLRDHPLAPAGPAIRADIEDLKQRVDLHHLITTFAGSELDKIGRQYRARCPFPDHDDATPSFYLHPEKQLWHCFGCQRGGDAISFIQYWFDLDFKEAIELLRSDLGGGHPTPHSGEVRRTRVA